jgi:hypothetical protein
MTIPLKLKYTIAESYIALIHTPQQFTHLPQKSTVELIYIKKGIAIYIMSPNMVLIANNFKHPNHISHCRQR